MTPFIVTVATKDGWLDLDYSAKTAKEAREWAARLDGVLEVVHLTVRTS